MDYLRNVHQKVRFVSTCLGEIIKNEKLNFLILNAKRQIKCKFFFFNFIREFPFCDIKIPNGYSMFNFKNEKKMIQDFIRKKENSNSCNFLFS